MVTPGLLPAGILDPQALVTGQEIQVAATIADRDQVLLQEPEAMTAQDPEGQAHIAQVAQEEVTQVTGLHQVHVRGVLYPQEDPAPEAPDQVVEARAQDALQAGAVAAEIKGLLSPK